MRSSLGRITLPVVVVMAVLLELTTVHAQAPAPKCRFPGPWTHAPVNPVRTTTGAALSPIQIVADPSVLRDPDRFRMWFTTSDSKNRTGIAYAEGTDGVTWSVWKKTDSTADPLIDLVVKPTAGGWDGLGVETASVVRAPSGKYFMYYTGNRPPAGSNSYAIGLATSTDGVRWTKRATPVLQALYAWEKPYGPLDPSVLYDPRDNLFKMWYAAAGVTDYLSIRIGYATSVDGITWSRRSAPVFVEAAGQWDELWVSHPHVVADPIAGFHLFYFSSRLADYGEQYAQQRGAIGHAYSPDGVTWTRNPQNPVVPPGDGFYDAWTVGGPTVLVEGSEMWMWYHGFTSSGSLLSTIGLTKAPCP